jgi:hypothetical protein
MLRRLSMPETTFKALMGGQGLKVEYQGCSIKIPSNWLISVADVKTCELNLCAHDKTNG